MRLYLLRHAEAQPGAEHDIERPLTTEALEHLNNLSIPLDNPLRQCEQVVSSSYRRAMQTAEAVSNSAQLPAVINDIRLGSHVALDSTVQLLEEVCLAEVSSILLVTHQPVITQMIAFLCDDAGYVTPAPREMATLELDYAARGLGRLLSWQRL